MQKQSSNHLATLQSHEAIALKLDTNPGLIHAVIFDVSKLVAHRPKSLQTLTS